MPPAFIEHASPTAKRKDTVDKSREMDVERRQKHAAVCPTDDEAVALKGSKPHKQSWDYIWRTGVAGGMAGCAAKTAVAPLDRVKILFQTNNPQFAKYTGSWVGVMTTMKTIYTEDGTRGLFRGHSATLLRIFPYAAIKFLAYEQIRAAVIKNPQQETSIRRLLSGSLAGVTSVFFTYPLEVIRVRLAFETKHDSRSSLSDICKRIYSEAAPASKTSKLSGTSPAALVDSAASAVQAIAPKTGLGNFYRGFSATIMGMLPYAGMSFLTHDTAGDLLRHASIAEYTTLPKPESSPIDKPAPLRSWAELAAGGIAGLVSQTSSYPLEVIRRRMQVGGAVGDGHRLHVGETARKVWMERGWRGFFVGLSIGYAKVIPLAAISFYTYERGKMLLGI
ncbi:mitochondrial carrier protein [Phlyctema vagabunda]|uniref:Mitochondrial thiamine pyrophosphate carrier 1 n=1 Tax=Phlyctema vagabunda TaxID=108571 RepID=A0ABR4PU41_9HELO